MSESRLDRIEAELRRLDADIQLAIEYMREIATIMGARKRLEAIDDRIRARRNGDTDPAPALPEGG